MELAEERFRELAYGSASDPSIHDRLGGDQDQRHVLDYLTSFEPDAAASRVVECVLGCGFKTPLVAYSDGERAWYSDLAHYVEHHALQISDELAARCRREAT